MSVTYY